MRKVEDINDVIDDSFCKSSLSYRRVTHSGCEKSLQLRLPQQEPKKQELVRRRRQQQPSIIFQKRQLFPPTVSPPKPLKISMKSPAVYGILPHLPNDFQNDRAIVLMAARQNWREIRHVHPNSTLTSDKEISLAAVEQDWRAYCYITNKSKEVAMTVVAKYWQSLPHMEKAWRDDFEIALSVVAQYWRAIASVNAKKGKLFGWKKTKSMIPQTGNTTAVMETSTDTVLPAVLNLMLPEYDPKADVDAQRRQRQGIHNALEILKFDKQFVTAAVQQDGMVLKYLPNNLRSDKDVVLAAIQNKPDTIKYALGGLNQDPDCWYAANLWNVNYFTKKHSSHRISVALSTRFDLNEDNEHSVVTHFTIMLNDTPYFRDGKFTIYSPNAFKKSTCDPDWTNPDWPCRGNLWSCRKPIHLKLGKPTNKSCWRYSYRYHLEEAKRSNGFMLQVVDYDAKTGRHVLGRGQQIEMMMAKEVGTKVFRICQPVENGMDGHVFESCHIAELHSNVSEWYYKNNDLSTSDASSLLLEGCEIQFHRENEAQHWHTYVRGLPADGDLLQVKDPWDLPMKDPWKLNQQDGKFTAKAYLEALPRWKVYGRSLAVPDNHLHGESIF